MLILGYHDFGKTESNPWTLTPERFEWQLDFLRDRGYTFLGLSEALREGCDRRVRSDPNADKIAVVTVDDARLGAYVYGSAALNARQIVGLFYICPGLSKLDVPANEGYSPFMMWHQVKHLHLQGHQLGSHAMQHCDMTPLSEYQLKIQLYGSMVEIWRHTGTWCEHFAPPYGLYNKTVQDAVAKAGYETLVTTDLGLNRPPVNLFALKRYQVRSDEPDAKFQEYIERLEAGDVEET